MVPKTGPQYLFAFVAHLFSTHGAASARRDLRALEAKLAAWEAKFRTPLKETAARLTTFSKTRLPVDHEKEELVAIAEEITAAREFVAAPNGAFVDEIARCYADARAFDQLLEETVFVSWQSMCLRVLSRRFREEIDVDDGTFTQLQVAKLQPVLNELELDEEAGLEQLALITKMYKRYIRDLKRIFGYYAASKPGDVGTMDKAECVALLSMCTSVFLLVQAA